MVPQIPPGQGQLRDHTLGLPLGLHWAGVGRGWGGVCWLLPYFPHLDHSSLLLIGENALSPFRTSSLGGVDPPQLQDRSCGLKLINE